MYTGIIVVDVPRCCVGCMRKVAKLGDLYCEETDRLIIKDEYYSRPDWCPIQPMPEKKPLTGDVSNPEKVGTELVRVGWNACIDEILK